MAKTFKRNNFGRMVWVWYQRPIFKQLLLIGLSILGFCIERFGLVLADLKIEQSVMFEEVGSALISIGLVLFGITCLFRFYKFVKMVKKFSRLRDFYAERKAIKAIEKGLLSAGLVRKVASESIVKIPSCAIDTVDSHSTLTIEKLPSLSDIDKVTEAVNSSLRVGKLANYAVTEPFETSDGLYYVFELNDVNRDLTFKPKSLDGLIPDNPYKFKMMKGVYWSYVDEPHAIIAGLTGSHKTTTMFVFLAQALAIGADVYILDYKQEMTGLKSFLGSEKVVSEPSEILDLLSDLVSALHVRNKKLAELARTTGQISVTGADFNARPVFLFAEELGALTENFDSKERKQFHGYLKQIAMLGRSSLFNIICLVQVPTVESVPAGIKSNANLKILLEKSTQEMVTQMFSSGYINQVTNNPGRFRGWYFQNGKTTKPNLFFVPNLYQNRLNSLETFERLHERGLSMNYNKIL